MPSDNPFLDDPRLLDEYWAIGLRNPFRISFDRSSGALWAGDVGSAVWEEVNLIEKGGDYLYPQVEGWIPDDYVPDSSKPGRPNVGNENGPSQDRQRSSE